MDLKNIFDRMQWERELPDATTILLFGPFFIFFGKYRAIANKQKKEDSTTTVRQMFHRIITIVFVEYGIKECAVLILRNTTNICSAKQTTIIHSDESSNWIFSTKWKLFFK